MPVASSSLRRVIVGRNGDGAMATVSKRNQLVAAIIGNLLEWYDFLVYGFVASTIARLFFPAQTPTAGLLLTFMTFGAGFFARPIGGLLLSYCADRYGRKPVLTVIIGMMTAGVALIAFAPTYASIGIAAPLMILLGRVVQGLSSGGEFSSATAFLIEHAPPEKKGLYGAWQMASQGLAILLAGLVGTAVTKSLTPEQLDLWGWRVPFIVGLLIGPVGLYIRRNLDETPEFEQAVLAGQRASLRELFSRHWDAIVVGICMLGGAAATTYTLIVFLPTYAVRTLHLDLSIVMPASIVSGVTLTLGPLAFGALSDRVGRRIILIAGLAGLVVTIYPCFVWLNDAPSFGRLMVVQFVFALLLSIYWGPFGAVMCDLFPVRMRSTGMAMAYNLGVLLFGGFAPAIVVWMTEAFATNLAPAYYVTAGVSISLIALVAMKRILGREVGAVGVR
jgi:MFS transporter, MHS family, proline/betaine transporter